MSNKFAVDAVFRAIDRVTAPVTRMQNRINRMTRATSAHLDSLNRKMDKISVGIKSGITKATVATTGMGFAMADVISTGADFEQTLVNAAAKFPGEIRKGTEEFNLLSQAAQRVGATTEFSASESASALNYLAMAGFDAKSAVSALPGVVNLATAAQIDLASATDIASDSLGAFGLMSKDPLELGKNLSRVNDVLAKTTTTSNTNMEQLFETIKQAGPVATSAGASLETFAAIAGQLANAGIKGSQAGTTMKNMFLSLSAPSTTGAKALEKLGVTTVDSAGNMLDITNIIGQLQNSLDGLGSAERADVLNKIFGKIPIAGVNVLLKTGAKGIKDYTTQLENATGASTKMSDTMRDTLQGRFKSLMSVIESVKISIFSLNSGPLNDVVDRMTNWVRVNKDLIASKIGGFLKFLIDNLGTIVTWVKRIAIGLAVFWTLATALKTIATVMTIVNAVMAMNPIGLIVIAIGALIGAIAAVIYWWDELSSGFMSVASTVSNYLIGGLDRIPNSLKAIGFGIGLLFGPIGWLISAAIAIMSNWGGLRDFFGGLISGVIFYFNKIFNPFERFKQFAQILKLAWEPLKGFFSGFWDSIVIGFQKALDFFNYIDEQISSIAKSIIDKIPGGSWIAEKLGFGGSDDSEKQESKNKISAQVVSPQERIARNIEEKRQSAELTIRDETGRAELSSSLNPTNIIMQRTGAF
ncbi:phage tail tape measure protein [Francisella philomiragia]|uniref:Phage tail tape measure protein n=1 Tax=Francisella philomiragia TaxID=28110 RepID=A0ABS1GC70_9GAMM|nr:phage tail tape measure protein [Francisella philomiragia]MBK2258737.1 phage tail tape measure protein [Francisella philomiragia]MBK2302428.1 phage tail tape measure protein [Francisella philomiragia]